MGRWIDWRVSEDLTAAEVEAMATVINGPLREALRLVAKQIGNSRPTAPNLMARLAFHYKDRATAEYAADPRTVVITDGKVSVAGSDDSRGLDFSGVAGDHSGHTIGFQDYVSIGVLAAASQVSGKVELTRGDDIDGLYVEHVLQRIADAGMAIQPRENFASRLPIDEAAMEGSVA
ncbi:hypothetical protein HFO56_01565 [Rhizobium laguerreae]|uniref:hypothetical protein n=1 Tax=Rhizobium laguerreae TaxID=1076926 RepID=UPI001C8FEA65|nr:hypothetical protein [Rhizobium laguerreae]MBY3151098.1 hypothetical protein [Rhizobium laguerreae]